MSALDDAVYRKRFHLRDPRDLSGLNTTQGLDSDRVRAEQVARRVGRRLAFVPGRGWLICNDEGVWEADPSSQKVRELVYMSTTAESEPGVRRAENFLKSICLVDADEFLEHPDVLHVAEGQVLVLSTGEVRPCEPEDFCQWSTGVHWNPSATYEPWSAFLRWIFPNLGEADWAQRFFGYLLHPVAAEEKVLLLHGPGGDGKSTLLETVAGVLGRYAQSGIDPALVLRRGRADHPTEIASLSGKRLAWINELADDAALDEAKLKRLVSTGWVRARFMQRDFIEIPITWKLVITTNELPDVHGVNRGTWRRIVPLQLRSLQEMVQTGQTIGDEGRPDVDDLKVLLQGDEAKEAVLRWLVEGYRRWRDAPLAEMTEAMADQGVLYRLDQDRCAAFVDAYLVLGEGSVGTAELMALVGRRGRDFGVTPKLLTRWLEGQGCYRTRHHDGTERGPRGWRGVHLRVGAST